MAYIGALAVIFAVFLIWREYSSYLDKELSACRAFLSAITDYREKVRCYLDSPREWAKNYDSELLDGCGFLGLLREGADFGEAYLETRDKLCLSDEADAILSSCFQRLGEGYLEGELEILALAIEKLGKEEAASSVEFVKKKKAVGAMLGAVAAGIVILII